MYFYLGLSFTVRVSLMETKMALAYYGLIFFFLFYLIYRKLQQKYDKLPPGPPCIPIVGSFPFLNFKNGTADAMLDRSFWKLFPDMYTVWIGYRPLVIIQNFDLAKDLFAREEYCGRALDYHENYIRGNNGTSLGIVKSQGLLWQEQRRFTVKHLKDLGFGKHKLEPVIQDEAQYLIDDFVSKSKLGDVRFDNDFNIPIINILWQIVVSKRFEADLPESKEMIDTVSILFKTGAPFLSRLWIVNQLRELSGLPVFKRDTRILDLKSKIRSQILENVCEFNLSGSNDPKNFTEIYVKEINEREKLAGQGLKKGHRSTFHIEQLVTLCLDFFLAGSETSSTTLSWAVLYLTLYPEVQKKCREEIERNLGGNLPSKDDVSRLIYCVATIQEIQRISCVAPATVLHSTMKDVTIKDYMLPKDTIIVGNLTKFMMDPGVFPEPNKLIPERFIQDDGKKISIKVCDKIKYHFIFEIKSNTYVD